MEMDALPKGGLAVPAITIDSKLDASASDSKYISVNSKYQSQITSSKEQVSAINWPKASTKRILLFGVVLFAIEHLVAASLLYRDLLLHYAEFLLLKIATLSFIPFLIVLLGIYGALKECKLSLLVVGIAN